MAHGKIDYISLKTAKLSDCDIYFDDGSNTKIDSILRSVRSMHKRYGINVVVVDYLQLVSSDGKGMNREQQIANIARSLKNIAKDLNICVIVLSQLNRNTATQSHKPALSRLRDSGQIEEAADIVMFCYRPEKYGLKKYDNPFERYEVENTALIDIAKGRNIGTHQFVISFNPKYTLFSDYSGGMYKNDSNPTFYNWE
jgi:replicative DNA helicase